MTTEADLAKLHEEIQADLAELEAEESERMAERVKARKRLREWEANYGQHI